MAPPRRAAKQAVSYQESESNDESSDADFSETSERDEPRPQAPRRKQAPSRAVASPSSAAVRTRTKPRVAYAEDFNSELENDSDFVSDEEVDAGAEDDRGGAEKVQKLRTTAPRTKGRSPRKATNAAALPRKPRGRRPMPESSPPAITSRIRKGMRVADPRGGGVANDVRQQQNPKSKVRRKLTSGSWVRHARGKNYLLRSFVTSCPTPRTHCSMREGKARRTYDGWCLYGTLILLSLKPRWRRCTLHLLSPTLPWHINFYP